MRAVRASAEDAVFCDVLARNAVHAAMAGQTDILVGRWHRCFTHVPLPSVLAHQKRIEPGGEVNGISVSIDLQQLAYLDNLKLDYSEDLMGGGFRFQNPLATSVCGCGNSFSIVNGESQSERWQLPT